MKQFVFVAGGKRQTRTVRGLDACLISAEVFCFVCSDFL